MPEIQPTAAPKRHDPPSSKATDGAISDRVWLINRDPDRVYCEANPNDAYCGVPFMQTEGWEIERHRKDGPRYVGGDVAKDGSAMTRFGQILMSRSAAMQAEYEARKAQVATDRARAIGQRGGVDRVVGPTGQLAHNAVEETIERSREA